MIVRPMIRSVALVRALLVTATLLVSGMDAALAQDFGKAQQEIGKNLAQIPPAVAVFAYVMGAFFTVSGLLKLKAWIGDSDRNTLNAALFRLVVASLLIYLPYGIMVMNKTMFGDSASNTSGASVPPPVLSPFGRK